MPKTRRASSSLDRDETGTFKRACHSIIHDSEDINSTTLFNLKTGKKLRQKTFDLLLEKGCITKHTKYICSACVSKVENVKESQDLNSSKGPESSTSVNNDQGLSDYQSCAEVGKYLSGFIQSDVSNLYNTKDKCSLHNLLGYNPSEWLNERPKALVGLLRELCGYDDSSNLDVDKQLKLARCIELIYGCRNSKLVLPLSFQENLLIYSLSRNKQLLNYNSKVAPAGSTDTISKWLSVEASSPVQFPEGIVRSVFDNEQVIGKTYKVRAQNKVPSSVITSHLYICIDPESSMQRDDKLTPENWLFQEPNESQKVSFLTEEETCTNMFRTTRDNFIEKRLASVIEDHANKNVDFIDITLSRKQEIGKEKICIACGGENTFTSRKCSNCKGELVTETYNFEDLYAQKTDQKLYSSFYAVGTESHDFSVKTGEPDLCNPNSFENVAEILKNISHRAGINGEGNERKWLFLECDGGIYTLVEKLLFNVYRCTHCDESFYGLENFSDHRCCILYDIPHLHQFGWLLPLPGLLHIEMNGCKAFFELTWDIFLKDVCMKLGFNSPKALDYAKSCGDHHKSWKVLEIVLLATADELLVPYVRHCLNHQAEPTVGGYWHWAANVVDPNYLFLQQMVFTFLHSLMLFRTGCRRGNAEAIIAGREKLSLLFFARNHPRYQRIHCMNKYIEALMPQELKTVVRSSFTLSRTGNLGHYQGGDACLEEINKEAKSWISPRGIPSDNEWQRVFRNLDGLMQLQKKTVNMATGNTEVGSHSQPQEQKVAYREIMPVREMLRQKEYFLKPMEERQHSSLDGQIKLCNDLQNFTAESEYLKERYFYSFLGEDIQETSKLICITEQEKCEKMCIQNQTKANIHKSICQLLEEKPSNEAKLLEDVFSKTVKGKCKEEYIRFYYMLKEDSE